MKLVPYLNEVKITEDTRKALSFLEKEIHDNYISGCVWKDSIHDYFEQKGYDVHASTGVAFVHPRKTQVIKIGYLTRSTIPKTKRRIPTNIYLSSEHKNIDLEDEYVIMVQPKCQPISSQEWTDNRTAIVRMFSRTICDLHENNVGIYKGEYVLFDW